MSYRTIAFASCLFAVGCGGSAPPPGSGATPQVAAVAPGADKGSGDGPAEAGAPPASTAPAAGSAPQKRKDEGGEGKAITQAVVETQEPLSGKLTQEDIRRILEKSGDAFGDCYTLGAGGKMKDFKGVVTVKATIGPLGVVNQVEVTKSTAHNVKVDACVSEAFKKIKFPRPRDGGTSVITFPIAFNGVEQVQ